MAEKGLGLDLDDELTRRLRRSRVQVEVPDESCVILKRVPTNGDCFNKPHTNLLVTRVGPGAPLLVGVDEDLEYRGGDLSLERAFAHAVRQQGWRVLALPRAADGLEEGLADALQIVGYDGATPSFPAAAVAPPRTRGTLDRFAAEMGGADLLPVIGREEEIRCVLACVLALAPRLPVLVGPTGIGKTAVLRGAARALALRRGTRLLRLDLAPFFGGTLFASEREQRLANAITEAGEEDVVLAVEGLPLALAEAPHGEGMLAAALERGVRLIGTAAIEVDPQPGGLAGHVEVVRLAEPDLPTVREIVLQARAEIERHHRLSIEDDAIEAVLDLAGDLPGALPGKALALLDSAAARASIEDAPVMGRCHVYWAGGARNTAEDD